VNTLAQLCCAAAEQRPVRLVAQIHDELLLEVNPQLCDVYVIAGKQSNQPLSVMQAFCNWNASNCLSCICTALMHCMVCCMPGCLHLSQGASRHAVVQVLCSKSWKALRA
jgi:hypothetical protein